jgi:V8-like Glu-specific endopeptidase
MGTGYLVGADVVVTAAHNVYNDKKGGAAIKILCYIGYNGYDNLGSFSPC